MNGGRGRDRFTPSSIDAGGVTRFQALRRGLCPVCRGAPIFAGRWRMNETCPACNTRFERAPGYFVGAMYISYALALIVLVIMVAIFQLGAFRSWPLPLVVSLALVIYVLLVPALFRWSRILWIHIGERFGW
jgi:uncharacterized protein (DUF983 family)